MCVFYWDISVRHPILRLKCWEKPFIFPQPFLDIIREPLDLRTSTTFKFQDKDSRCCLPGVKVSMKRKLFLGSYKIYPFKHAIPKFAGVKIADFVSVHHVMLVPRIAIHHGGREEKIFLHRCCLMCERSCLFQNR